MNTNKVCKIGINDMSAKRTMVKFSCMIIDLLAFHYKIDKEIINTLLYLMAFK